MRLFPDKSPSRASLPLKQQPAPGSIALALVLLTATLSAQAASLSAPTGAQLMQQAEATPAPKPMSSADLVLKNFSGEDTANPLPASARFMLQRIQITHNTLFDTSTLHALVADAEGQETTLPLLAELAARITHYYRSRGYPLSRAIIPAQSIATRDSVVSIRVVEAQYGNVALANTSQVRNDLLQATMAPLTVGNDVQDAPLKNVLLLLSDIPGTEVKAIYRPGQTNGTANVTLEITPSPRAFGSVAVDNYGNAYTGQQRLSSSLTVTNPLHQGDTFNASVLSAGKGLSHWRLAYEATLNGLGSRAGASSSTLDYALGGEFAPLGATGDAAAQSLWIKHPVVRSPAFNLYAQAQYDQLQTHDRSSGNVTRPERLVRSATLSLSGDAQVTGIKESPIHWKLAWTSGQLRSTLSSPVISQPSHFGKFNLNLAYHHRFGAQSTLSLSYAGQRARPSLDPSQKMSAGGPYTVRAYAMGAVSGDSGDVLSAEWQQRIGQGWAGDWQAVAFVDSARITVDPVKTTSADSASLSGAGLGLNWRGRGQWTVRTAVARPLGAKSALVNADKAVRLWLEVNKAF